jgi:hypothetical protein
MMKLSTARWCSGLLGVLLSWHTVTASAQTGTITSSAADAQIVNIGGTISVTDQATSYTRVGNNAGDSRQQNVVLVFQIPATLLAADDLWFTASTLTTKLGSVNATGFNGDLYGLPYRTSPTVLTTDFYAGAADPNPANSLIQNNYLTPAGTPTYATPVTTGTALTAYLNTQLANARANNATTAYVFLRVNQDATFNWQFYIVAMNEAGANAGKLDYTYASIPTWREVPLGGGGYVTGIISDPTGTDVYIRTDTGGALKWSEAGQQWNSITDLMVPLTLPSDSNLLQTMSIALDPSDSNKLYIAVGGGGVRGIYSSANKGGSWTKINPATDILINGNSGSRAMGERLAVDPNNPNLMWYGSEQGGLYKGTNSAGTWTWAQVPTGQVPLGTSGSGVSFVVCDKNGSSTITYAGVVDSSGTTGGVYRTTNNTDWTKLTSMTIARPARAAVSTDGTLFVTSWDSVARMPRGGTFTNVTPSTGKAYRAVAVSPDGQTVYISGNVIKDTNSIEANTEIWRSSNSGTNWFTQGTSYYNHRNLAAANQIPQGEEDGTLTVGSGWFGRVAALMIKPGNVNELWATDYFGVLRTYTANKIGGTTLNNEPIWYRIQRGQEETVVEVLKVPPTGPKLMTGLADIGGYRYNDITARPYGAAGNAFGNPSGANTTSLDFCETNPNHWVRAWYGNNSNGTGATSSDGGVTWLSFGQAAGKTVSSMPAEWVEFDVTVYLQERKTATPTGLLTLMLASGTTSDTSSATLSFDSLTQANQPHLLVNGVTYLPTEDAMVNGATASAGTPNPTGTLGVAYAYNTNANDRQSYLKFNLSALPATFTSCKLRVYKNAQTTARTYPLGVFGVSNTSWSETTLTYNNRPAPYASTSKKPYGDPRYWEGGLPLFGGRVAISATDPNNLVWMPFWRTDVWPHIYVPPHYSTDRGVTWKQCLGLPAEVTLLKSKSGPSYVLNQLTSDRVDGSFYIARFSASGGDTHIYRSSSLEKGANWTHVGTADINIYNVYRVQIMAAPTSGHLWIADDGIEANPSVGGLWKSTNHGVTWTRVQGSSVRSARTVSFGKPQTGSTYPYTVFYSGFYNGVLGIHRSDNEGATWNSLPPCPTSTWWKAWPATARTTAKST